MRKLLWCIFPIILIQSCNQNKYNVGVFPETATNLGIINSAFDDINSDMPTVNHEFKLVFSSNRIGSQPNHFNLVGFNLVFYWDRSEGFLSVGKGNSLFDNSLLDWVRRTESTYNEKGPYSFVDSENDKTMLFSRDDDQGIYSIYAEPEIPSVAPNARTNQSFQLFEESVSEMYPSFYGENYLKGSDISSQGKPEKFLMSSDREGVFDIYELDLPSDISPLDYLLGTSAKPFLKISINSTANDHMPFVYGDLLVFASDRAGGYGGYDLYYSFKTDSGWSEPVNFGPNINSDKDEYRPIVSENPGFSNRLMIFSSNRPGGLGGFDLYYVGIPKF
ncbi:hypothetical protein [Algoriphagus sp.]|uniref:hypothetical protein n=1 Tax=Algoriphagus sp. TaxID=1872435 RepID=UPI003284ED00